MDKINKKISHKFELNQWENTDIVAEWFKQIKNQNLHQFATFDIKEFYPSIKNCLLKNVINFAEQHTEISEKDKAIIFHARKSLLFNGNLPNGVPNVPTCPTYLTCLRALRAHVSKYILQTGKLKILALILLAPISQNGQTHSNISSAICRQIV